MSHNNNTKKLGLLTVLFGVLLGYGPASIASTYGTVNATVSLPTLDQKTNTLRTSALPGSSVYAGQFSGVFNSSTFTTPGLVGADTTFEFVGWCLEPQEFWKNTSEYSFVDIGDAPQDGAGSTMSTRGVDDDMQRLFGGVNPNTASFLSDQLNRDAFQLAVWEIANETTTDLSGKIVFNVDDSSDDKGGFFLQQIRDGSNGWSTGYESAVVALANSWLANAADEGLWGRATLYAIVSSGVAPNGQQDFVVQANVPTIGGGPTVAPVPLPAAFWLFGSALLGTLGIARRRSNRLAA